jgi:hypothetical protein
MQIDVWSLCSQDDYNGFFFILGSPHWLPSFWKMPESYGNFKWLDVLRLETRGAIFLRFCNGFSILNFFNDL